MGARGRTVVCIVLALATAGSWLSPARAAATSIKVVSTYDHITVKRPAKDQPAFVDLGACVASVGGAFELRATKADYSQPVEVKQVDAEDPSTTLETVPPGKADPFFGGLQDFFAIEVQKPNGNFAAPRNDRATPSWSPHELPGRHTDTTGRLGAAASLSRSRSDTSWLSWTVQTTISRTGRH